MAEQSAEVPVDIEQFKRQLKNRIGMFLRQRSSTARTAARVGLFVAVLSALATIAIGFSEIFKEIDRWFSALALVCTASAAGIQTWGSFFSHKRSHVFYSDGAQRLYQIKRDLEHIACGSEPVDQSSLRQLYHQFQTTLQELHEEWRQLRLEEGEAESK